MGSMFNSSHGLKKVHDPAGSAPGPSTATAATGTTASCPTRAARPAASTRPSRRPISAPPSARGGGPRPSGPPESQTERFKYDVAYPAYRTPGSERTELDHLVPLELGGSNDATNLWPEYPPTPNPKDKVENALNAAVCDGRITLAAAQNAIAADWLTAEKKLGIGGTGRSGSWCTASASYDATYGDYDIDVQSDQPDKTVTAAASNGASHSWHTDSSGYAVVYLDAGSVTRCR